MRLIFVPILTVLAAASGLTGCGEPAETPAQTALEEPGYAMPPTVSDVSRQAGGGLTISGRAGPDERIRLVDLAGSTHGTTADRQGEFRLTLPDSEAGDHLLSLTVQRAGRAVASDGWLFAPGAAPERAVMLRPGSASLPIGAAPLLAVIDYDGGGGVALSGVSEPGADVSMTLDGRPQGQVTTGADGRWFASLAAPVADGSHSFVATSGGRQAGVVVALGNPDPVESVEVSRFDGGVRVAWRLPGGGDQTTFILTTE